MPILLIRIFLLEPTVPKHSFLSVLQIEHVESYDFQQAISTIKSISSQSIAIQLTDLQCNDEECEELTETLLALRARITYLSFWFTRHEYMRPLRREAYWFPRLREAGILNDKCVKFPSGR